MDVGNPSESSGPITWQEDARRTEPEQNSCVLPHTQQWLAFAKVSGVPF
jgi:hypothetical protein